KKKPAPAKETPIEAQAEIPASVPEPTPFVKTEIAPPAPQAAPVPALPSIQEMRQAAVTTQSVQRAQQVSQAAQTAAQVKTWKIEVPNRPAGLVRRPNQDKPVEQPEAAIDAPQPAVRSIHDLPEEGGAIRAEDNQTSNDYSPSISSPTTQVTNQAASV